MTDLDRKIKAAEKKATALMKTTKWQQSIERSDKQIDQTLEKLRKDSKVDPKLLDEPATL